MKLKSLPDDFRVEEVTGVRPSRGPFALYRLNKRGIGTPEAVSAILQDWNLPRRALSYGGLKDRHAVTTQYLTIHNGPNKSHEDRSYRLEYLGQCPHEYHAQDIQANRFEICLRNLLQEEHAAIQQRCELIKQQGTRENSSLFLGALVTTSAPCSSQWPKRIRTIAVGRKNRSS